MIFTTISWQKPVHYQSQGIVYLLSYMFWFWHSKKNQKKISCNRACIMDSRANLWPNALEQSKPRRRCCAMQPYMQRGGGARHTAVRKREQRWLTGKLQTDKKSDNQKRPLLSDGWEVEKDRRTCWKFFGQAWRWWCGKVESVCLSVIECIQQEQKTFASAAQYRKAEAEFHQLLGDTWARI